LPASTQVWNFVIGRYALLISVGLLKVSFPPVPAVVELLVLWAAVEVSVLPPPALPPQAASGSETAPNTTATITLCHIESLLSLIKSPGTIAGRDEMAMKQP
jgi:hypothetical protein